MPYNIAPADINLSLTQALPATNASVTTGIIDIQATSPASNAWQLGRFKVTIPAIPENTAGAGITISLQAAPPSLTAGSAAIAPNMPPPGAFVTPTCAQTITVAAVAAVGSAATFAYFNLAVDANSSTYQFYQFVITVPAQINPTGEVLTIAFIGEAGD